VKEIRDASVEPDKEFEKQWIEGLTIKEYSY
jgi:hypothetical protein